jgi:hypothetical protein
VIAEGGQGRLGQHQASGRRTPQVASARSTTLVDLVAGILAGHYDRPVLLGGIRWATVMRMLRALNLDLTDLAEEYPCHAD